MEKKKSKLNTRQWDLYNFLKSQFEEGRYISKIEICTNLPQHYSVGKNLSRFGRTIEDDVRIINDSLVIQKIIVSNTKGYKIGTKEECEEYIEKRFNRDLKSLKLNWALSKKMNLDGQMRLTFGKQERDFIEAFIKE